jgi:hypothetical protein
MHLYRRGRRESTSCDERVHWSLQRGKKLSNPLLPDISAYTYCREYNVRRRDTPPSESQTAAYEPRKITRRLMRSSTLIFAEWMKSRTQPQLPLCHHFATSKGHLLGGFGTLRCRAATWCPMPSCIRAVCVFRDYTSHTQERCVLIYRRISQRMQRKMCAQCELSHNYFV